MKPDYKKWLESHYSKNVVNHTLGMMIEEGLDEIDEFAEDYAEQENISLRTQIEILKAEIKLLEDEQN